MPRLVLTAIALVLVALAVSAALDRLGRVVRSVRAPSTDSASDIGTPPMQRLSFVLLVALIFYAAIWGAG